MVNVVVVVVVVSDVEGTTGVFIIILFSFFPLIHLYTFLSVYFFF